MAKTKPKILKKKKTLSAAKKLSSKKKKTRPAVKKKTIKAKVKTSAAAKRKTVLKNANAKHKSVKTVKGTVKTVKGTVKTRKKTVKGKTRKYPLLKEITSPAVAQEKKIKKYKPNKKIKYTATELKHFREIILKERKAILESAKANMESLVDNETGEYKGDNLTYSTHMAEQGTDEMEREKNYMFVQRDEKYLGYLQDALMRIDQGTYGICVDCKEVPKNLCRTCPLIQKERLELVPITQHCIECKNIRG